jgi:tetratricopeptide (TPR) repeat protein
MESGKYSKAIKQFESLGDYSDAQEKIVECQNLEKGEYYRIALDYMDSGNYSKAIEKFEYLGDYSDAQEKLVECQNLKNEADYQAAIELMNSGEYKKAITKFKSLGDYSDAQEKIVECQNLLNENLSLANVGDTITLGSYEQDNNTTNGAESIEWIVLEKNDNSIFVISKYALDAQAFNSEQDYVTWETCTLRTWLNGTFYNNAFSTIEQGKIITHTYEATPNDYYGTSAGSDTQDKLCLLSNSEALKYFGSSGQDAGCSATAYAISKGLGTYGSKKIVGWLLRTPGETQIGVSYASIHNDDGTLWIAGNDSKIGGLYVDVIGGIRPVMWISTEG